MKNFILFLFVSFFGAVTLSAQNFDGIISVDIDTNKNIYVIGQILPDGLYPSAGISDYYLAKKKEKKHFYIAKYNQEMLCLWKIVVPKKTSLETMRIHNGNLYVVGNMRDSLKLSDCSIYSRRRTLFMAVYDISGKCISLKEYSYTPETHKRPEDYQLISKDGFLYLLYKDYVFVKFDDDGEVISFISE
jgi:hypothetical protein